ncbi:hypothetical protein HA402_004235 [Bradysia odoriphaga]|nr:hypothetical protein HA402_004235 [Bradysia odoriphaga]
MTGRKEIWNILRAAAESDYQSAKTILDQAAITVSNGTQFYDEMGIQYNVPIYCLSHPTNLLQEYASDLVDECSEGVVCGSEAVLKLQLLSSAELTPLSHKIECDALKVDLRQIQKDFANMADRCRSLELENKRLIKSVNEAMNEIARQQMEIKSIKESVPKTTESEHSKLQCGVFVRVFV